MKINKSICIVYLAFIILVWLPTGIAFAADQPSGSKQSFGESDDLFKDIPSVYTASKYEQKVTKAPASISIVTGDEIKKYGYRNFGAILASLKGFYSTSDRNYNYVGVRGFGLPGDYNSRLLLLIDGHRYNDNIFDSFEVDQGFPVDVDVIERVEVVSGPSSSLYGTSAVFGVINVITKQGRDQSGGNVKASYGSNDTYKTSFSAGNRFSNGFEAFITGTLYDGGGYNRLYYKEFDPNNKAFDYSITQPISTLNNGVAINSDEELSRKLMAKLAYGDFSLQGLYVNRRKDVPTASFSTVFNSQMQNTTDEAAFYDLKYDHTFDDQLNIKSRLSYNWYRYKGNYPVNSNPFARINKEISDGEWWRAELEASKKIWTDHRVTLGGQYQSNFHLFQTNYDIDTYVSSNVKTYQWAMFIQDDFNITNELTLNAGIRYDYFSIFGSTANPRIGLIYNPYHNSTLKLLYGTAFRAPNQYELNYVGAGIGIIASSGLKPEKLKTVELILEHYFTSQLRAEFNLFHTDINSIIFLKTLNDGNKQYQNVGNIDSNGLEIQLEQLFDNGFQGRISYSWQENRDKQTNQRLANSPEHMVKLNLIAPLWIDRVFVGFETQYMSGRNATFGGNVSDYVISNLTVFTQKWIKGLDLSAGVYNLFNERYFDPAPDAHRQNAIQQDGLTFRVQSSIDF